MSKRRQTRQAARAERKATRQNRLEARMDKKQARQDRKQAAQENKAEKIRARQARQREKTVKGIERKAEKLKQKTIIQPKIEEQDPEIIKEEFNKYIAQDKRDVVLDNYLKNTGADFDEDELQEIPKDEQQFYKAARFYETRADEIQDWAEENGMSEDEAEELLLSEEYEYENFSDFDPEVYDTFDPATLAVVELVGKKAYKEIAKKRAEKGLKTFGKEHDKQGNAIVTNAPVQKSLIGSTLTEAVDQYKKVETREALKEYAPFILIGSAVLVFVGYLIAKK